MTIPRSAVTVAIALAVALILAPFSSQPSAASTWGAVKAASSTSRFYPFWRVSVLAPNDAKSRFAFTPGLAVRVSGDGKWSAFVEHKMIVNRADETEFGVTKSLR